MNWWIIGCLGGGFLAFLLIILLGVWSFINAVSKEQQATTASSEVLPAASPSPPPGFVPAPAHATYLDLDTQDGHTSEWTHLDIGSASALYVRLRVARLGQGFGSVFYVGLRGRAKTFPPRFVGLRLYPARRAQPQLVLDAVRFDGNKLAEQHSFTKVAPLNQNVGVTIDWSTPGRATISLSDGERRQLALPWPVGRAMVSSSTGELYADPLELGKLTRAPLGHYNTGAARPPQR